MSVVTIRAAHNSYTFDQTGGTRDPQFEIQDRVAFMDAIEDRRTVVLDALKKGPASNENRPRWGLHGQTPRGSIVGAQLASGGTSLTLPTGHGARFQQGHVLQVTRKSDNEVEHLLVNDDPAGDTLTVVRGRGQTTPIQFEIGDAIAIIGIALPELSDFPQAPVSTGYAFYNRWQQFGKSIIHSGQAEVIPNVEYPDGDMKERNLLQQSKDIKYDLDRSLLLGRREAGVPSPAGPLGSTLGGLVHMAELSGNIYSLGGPGVLLNPRAIEFVQHDIDDKYGERGATTYMMSWNTLQIFESMVTPLKWNNGMSGTEYDTRFTKYRTSVGTIELRYTKDFPDGLILGWNPKNVTYNALEGHDWREKAFPTKGFYGWDGIGGIFTLKAKDIPGMFLIRGFDTNVNHYPDWSKPSTFLPS